MFHRSYGDRHGEGHATAGRGGAGGLPKLKDVVLAGDGRASLDQRAPTPLRASSRERF